MSEDLLHGDGQAGNDVADRCEEQMRRAVKAEAKIGGPDEVTNGDTKMDDIKSATDQLCELTKRWTTYEDVPRSQQYECREIGRKLHALGGEAAMRDAYYEATARNRAATVLAAYFDGIGDWRW